MSFKNFGSWLLTERGRKTCFGLACLASITTVSVKFLPNSFFLEQYKDVVRLYKDGLSVPIPKEMKKRFDEAIDLVGIGGDEKSLFKPFTVLGFDMFHAGTSYSKFGAIIGLPINFTYEDVDKIDKIQIKLKNESVPWGTEEATQLLNSLILSEKAQLYAIAREIKTADSAKLILDTLYQTVAVISCYAFSNFLNTKFNLYAKPRSMRMVLYSFITIFIFGNYCFLKDFTQMHYEHEVDKFLKEKNPIFIEGGKEYYEKILQRNKALRKLLGKEGEHRFSALGNENFFIRQKHIPLIHRKQFFEDTLVG